MAVNSASSQETPLPSAELTGSASRMLPSNMAIRKLSRMICVVDSDTFFFLISNTLFPVRKITLPVSFPHFTRKQQKGTSGLCSQLVPVYLLFSVLYPVPPRPSRFLPEKSVFSPAAPFAEIRFSFRRYLLLPKAKLQHLFLYQSYCCLPRLNF